MAAEFPIVATVLPAGRLAARTVLAAYRLRRPPKRLGAGPGPPWAAVLGVDPQADYHADGRWQPASQSDGGSFAMRMTTYTDYSLRTLMYLAVKPEGLATIADISSAYGISRNHLMKVVHQLGQAGIVETVRGRQGGLRLAAPPEKINLGDVVRQMEPDLEIAPCFAAKGACAIQPCCLLQRALQQALKAFLAVLDEYTLADLIGPRARLTSLLGIEPARRARGSAGPPARQ